MPFNKGNGCETHSNSYLTNELSLFENLKYNLKFTL